MEASTPKYRTATPSATRSRIREMKESSMFSTTPAVVCSASEASSCAVWSISANRSSWSRATFSSSAWVGRTAAAKRSAWASSSSRTAMSALRRPLTGSSPSIEEMTPRVKLLPVGLVNTLRPWARRTATSILVVVVFPLVPLTTTMPRGTSARACARKPGSTRSATSPGSAEPPPRSRDTARAALPATTAAVVLSTRQP